ncbi:TPA: hypothetical protein ACH3X1_007481 [Trebouxia sp. C0004]
MVVGSRVVVPPNAHKNTKSCKTYTHRIGIVRCYSIPDFIDFVCFRWKANSLLTTMDGQLEAVRQDIRNVQERIVKYEQKLATAERAGNKEEEKSLFDMLLTLNNQLLKP